MLENYNDYATFLFIILICGTILIWFFYNILAVFFNRYQKRIERLRKDAEEIEYQ